MAGRGKKLNQVKNERAHEEWVAWKKAGRPSRPSKNPQTQAELIHKGYLNAEGK